MAQTVRGILEVVGRWPRPLPDGIRPELVRLATLAAALGRRPGARPLAEGEAARLLRTVGAEFATRPGPGALFADAGCAGLPAAGLAEIWTLLGRGAEPCPARLPGDLLEALESTADRRGHGAFFTPDLVIRWLLSQTGLPDETAAAGLVDPACGGGAFLLAAYQGMAGSPQQRLARLAGVDLDRWAVATTRAALWLELPLDDPAEALLATRICHGDALHGAPWGDVASAPARSGPQDGAPPLHWPAAYPAGPAGGGWPFSHVVGNPPYQAVVRRGIGGARRRAPGDAPAGPANTFGLFLRRALELVQPGGRIGLVLPYSLARVKAYAPLRELIAGAGHVEVLADLGRATAQVGYEQLALVLRQLPDGPPSGARTRLVRLRGDRVEPRLEEDQACLISRRGIPLALDPGGLALLRRLEADHPRLSTLGTIFRGLPFSVLQPGYSAQERTGAWPCLRGGDLTRYRVRSCGWWRDDPGTVGRSAALRRRLAVAKLVMPNVVSSRVRANAALDRDGIATLDTVTNLVPQPGVPLLFLLGVLNSGPVTYLLREAVFNGALLTCHLDAPYLGSVPVPAPDCAAALAIAELAGRLVVTPDPQLDAQLDALVLQAYGLPAHWWAGLPRAEAGVAPVAPASR